MPTLPIANGFYESASQVLSRQTCLNCYPVVSQSGALSETALFPTPGIKPVITVSDYAETCRGAYAKNGIPYFVQGSKLYRLNRTVDSDGNELFDMVELGTIPGSERVSMVDNGSQLMIVRPGIAGYIYNEDDTTPFQQVTDPDYTAHGNPLHVVYVDGYFLLITDEKKFIISALNDGLSYNALDFGTAEADPDSLVTPVVYMNKVYLLGSETTESFRNIGGANFPFQRDGLFLSKGSFAQFGAITANNVFMMVGGGANESPAIWAFTGGTYQKMSTDAIDQVLGGYSREDVAACYAWTYAQDGAYFVGFTFPAATFVYDTINGRWHERGSKVGDLSFPWRVSSIVFAYGALYCGDTRDGRIGVLSPDVAKEYNEVIIRQFATQPFNSLADKFKKAGRVAALELTVESGMGNADDPDPEIVMDYTDDGKTWSQGLTRKLGKVGEYKKRVIWRRLGRIPRFRTFRFSMSAPIKTAFIKLEAEIK